MKVTFNLDINSTYKTRNIVPNVGRALVKNMVLMFGSKEIHTINNANIYDTYKDLYLSEKEREEKLLQIVQSANGLKAWVGEKKTNGIAITVTSHKDAIKKSFDKRFLIPWDFDFFKHLVYPYGLREDLIARLELYSSENVVLCSGDTAAAYKLSDFFFEYDAIFKETYATIIDELYVRIASILSTKVASIHY